MSRTKQMQKKRRQRERTVQRARRTQPVEQRSSEAITIMWMLTAVATLAALLVSLLASTVGYLIYRQALPPAVHILSGWFLFCAMVTGVVCLIITPIVYRFRATKPPREITIGVVLISLAPFAVFLVGSRL